MLTKRSHELEWMDLGADYYTSEEYTDCLHQLDRIGRFLGGDRATYRALKKLSASPASILDVGCGGGLFTMRLAKLYPEAQVKGIDLSSEAIAFALDYLKANKFSNKNLSYSIVKTPHLDESKTYDVVMSTLVCHHLTDSALIAFLKQACKIAKQAVILNDLHRHPLASIGFAILAPIFFRNKMIQHDGLLSIKRSFTKREWISLLKAAEIDEKKYSLSWHWPFRWIVRIDTA
jgi:2-polyprenyl-3-methyl-5-hydroxy-6-metoxy-1,4-benzoquinol methylase